MSKEQITQEVTDYLTTQPDGYIAGSPAAFLCVYGSSVYKPQPNHSDVDMLCAVPDTHVNSVDVSQLGKIIHDAHITYGHKVDQEVPYANKLLYSFSDLGDAVKLKAFERTGFGTILVQDILKEPEFLASRQVKLRLGLNALTTPNIVVGTTGRAEKAFTELAGLAVTALGISLNGALECRVSDIVGRLCTSGSGATGEMFLGYKEDHVAVMKHLQTTVDRSLGVFYEFGQLTSTSRDSSSFDVAAGFDAIDQMERMYDRFNMREIVL